MEKFGFQAPENRGYTAPPRATPGSPPPWFQGRFLRRVMWTRVGLVIASRTEATRVPSRKAGFIAGRAGVAGRDRAGRVDQVVGVVAEAGSRQGGLSAEEVEADEL